MAARKSCTHMTWAEAKAKAGGGSGNGGGTGGFKKNKEALRKIDHGKVLAQKVIAKTVLATSGTGGGSGTATIVDDKKLKRAHRKLEEKVAAIAAQRDEEREQRRLDALREVRPYDRVKEKVAQMMEERRRQTQSHNDDDDGTFQFRVPDDDGINYDDPETLHAIAECKQLQLDELMALEAMFPESDDFVMAGTSRLDDLKDRLEGLQEEAGVDDSDVGRMETLKAIARHPPLSFWIKLEVDDPNGTVAEPGADDEDDGKNGNDDAMDLNVILLMRVTLPPLYLDGRGELGGPPQMPVWTFEYVMVTDKRCYCSADRALESLAWLDEMKLAEAMKQEAIDVLLPYPCVYELSVVWLTEHIFEYLRMQTHLSSLVGTMTTTGT